MFPATLPLPSLSDTTLLEFPLLFCSCPSKYVLLIAFPHGLPVALIDYLLLPSVFPSNGYGIAVLFFPYGDGFTAGLEAKMN